MKHKGFEIENFKGIKKFHWIFPLGPIVAYIRLSVSMKAAKQQS